MNQAGDSVEITDENMVFHIQSVQGGHLLILDTTEPDGDHSFTLAITEESKDGNVRGVTFEFPPKIGAALATGLLGRVADWGLDPNNEALKGIEEMILGHSPREEDQESEEESEGESTAKEAIARSARQMMKEYQEEDDAELGVEPIDIRPTD